MLSSNAFVSWSTKPVKFLLLFASCSTEKIKMPSSFFKYSPHAISCLLFEPLQRGLPEYENKWQREINLDFFKINCPVKIIWVKYKVFLYANQRKGTEGKQNLHNISYVPLYQNWPFIIPNEKQLTWFANRLDLVGKLQFGCESLIMGNQTNVI